MVAFDLDGTLIEADKRIQTEMIAALHTLAQRDICCVTATGRKYAFQLDLFCSLPY